MSWDHHVYLAKKRIAQRVLVETFRKMCERYGPPDSEDGEDGVEGGFAFARFRVRLGEDAKAGMYLYVHDEDVGEAAEEAEDCMDEWAELLGGSISEEKWNERRARAEKKVLTTRKLPLYGPADTKCYIAFDGQGNERGRKSIAQEMVGHVKVQILDPAWLREHEVTCVECISFSGEGKASDQFTYAVAPSGEFRRVWNN